MTGEWIAACVVGGFAMLAIAAGVRQTRRINRAWALLAQKHALDYLTAADGGPRLTGAVHGRDVRIDVVTTEHRGRRVAWTRVRVDAALPPSVVILRDADAPGDASAPLKLSGAGADLVANTSPSLLTWLQDAEEWRDVRVSGGALEEYVEGVLDDVEAIDGVVEELVVRARVLLAARGHRDDAPEALAVAIDPRAPAAVRAEALHVVAIWAPDGWRDALDALVDDQAPEVQQAAREIRAVVGD